MLNTKAREPSGLYRTKALPVHSSGSIRTPLTSTPSRRRRFEIDTPEIVIADATDYRGWLTEASRPGR